MVTRRKLSIISLALALLLAACGTSAPEKQASIEDLGWFIENRDPSLASSESTARLFVDIVFADTTLNARDFASIKITNPADSTKYWLYDEAAEIEENFDSEYAYFSAALTSSITDNRSVIPLGGYKIEITLKNGSTATETLLVPAPASKTTEGYNFVYTENYGGAANPPSDYVALPKRAAITNATLDAQASTLDIAFSVDDATIYSGWLWFYNEAGDWLGYTDTLRDFETGAVMAKLNAGEAFFTDGKANALTFSASSEELNLEEDVAFTDIASVSVVLTDGEQYAGTKGSYDTRSRTAKFNVATIE